MKKVMCLLAIMFMIANTSGTNTGDCPSWFLENPRISTE